MGTNPNPFNHGVPDRSDYRRPREGRLELRLERLWDDEREDARDPERTERLDCERALPRWRDE